MDPLKYKISQMSVALGFQFEQALFAVGEASGRGTEEQQLPTSGCVSEGRVRTHSCHQMLQTVPGQSRQTGKQGKQNN